MADGGTLRPGGGSTSEEHGAARPRHTSRWVKDRAAQVTAVPREHLRGDSTYPSGNGKITEMDNRSVATRDEEGDGRGRDEWNSV